MRGVRKSQLEGSICVDVAASAIILEMWILYETCHENLLWGLSEMCALLHLAAPPVVSKVYEFVREVSTNLAACPLPSSIGCLNVGLEKSWHFHERCHKKLMCSIVNMCFFGIRHHATK